MGCGASGGGRGTKGNSAGGKYEENKEHRLHGEAADKAAAEPAGRKSKGHGGLHQTKQVQWHVKNCTDADLLLVQTINEAYPFKAEERKRVSKMEKVHGLEDRQQNWGHVSVTKMQKKVNCAACKGYILDRYEEMPFHFCMKCRNHEDDCHFELCIVCYNEGAHATGPREKSEAPKGAPGTGESMGGGKIQQVEGAHHSLHEDNPYAIAKGLASRLDTHKEAKGRLSASPNHSPRPGPAPRGGCGGGKPHATIPSGNWKGKVSEGASSRPTVYKLMFAESGAISGTGPESCAVDGKIGSGAKGADHKFTWTETYAWGKNDVTGTFHYGDHPVQIKSTFKSSDGGGGKIDLTSA